MDREEFFTLCCRFLSPEVSDDLAALYSSLADHNLCDVEIELNGLLAREHEIDSSVFSSLIIDFVVTRVINVLREEGIIFYGDFDGTDTTFLNTLFHNHLLIKEQEETYWIYKLIEDRDETTTNLDIYYEIQTSISEYGTENMYEYVESVTHTLIDNIKDLCDDEDEEDPIDPATDSKKKTFPKEIKAFYKENPDVKNFLNEYFDVSIFYELDALLADSYFMEVIITDTNHNNFAKVVGLYILLYGHVCGNEKQVDTWLNDICYLAHSANNIPMNDLTNSVFKFKEVVLSIYEEGPC